MTEPVKWKLVPVEPTPEMLSAGYMALLALGKRETSEQWRAMLDAAPSSPPAQALPSQTSGAAGGVRDLLEASSDHLDGWAAANGHQTSRAYWKAKALAKPASEPAGGGVRDIIAAVLRDYRLSNMRDGDGDAYMLVDLMSNDGCSIATGEAEMVILADEIALALANAAEASRKPLVERLMRCAEDPMWPDHAEVSKSLLLMAIAAIQSASPADLHTGTLIAEVVDWMRHWGFDLGFGEPEDISSTEIIEAIRSALPDGANQPQVTECPKLAIGTAALSSPASSSPAEAEALQDGVGAISHTDLCRLSRVFCDATGPTTWQDNRINEWLKSKLIAARLSSAPAQEDGSRCMWNQSKPCTCGGAACEQVDFGAGSDAEGRDDG